MKRPFNEEEEWMNNGKAIKQTVKCLCKTKFKITKFPKTPTSGLELILKEITNVQEEKE
jgi:hypothetical protein